MKFKVGDIVRIPEEFYYYNWYHTNNMNIIGIVDHNIIIVDYEFDSVTYNNNSINECYLELNKNELRKKKLESL
ncbi:hypothetical protein M0Q50_05265 [bacterium]|jgi:hypothetical protein|nr:hypothetical protein [bacterium]